MMINSRDQEDHVELSINPEFPTYAGVPVHPIHKFDTIAELQSEPTSIDQAPQGKHSEPVPRPFWKEQSTVNGLFANVPLWDKIFVTSCVIAVCMDPLFFYIPVINEEQKCLGKDKKLRDVALLLRFLTDITFLLNIIYQIRERVLLKTKPSTMEKLPVQTSNDEERGGNSDWDDSWKGEYTQFTGEIANIYSRSTKKIAKKLPWLTLPVFIDILSVIPIPQVLLVYAFFEMRGPGYLDYRKILSTFLLAQYLPRIFRIFLSSREFTKTTGIWVKGAFNFFLYILASHVLGAFWYFFSIQRETSCWHRACVKYANESLKGSCMDHFYCSDNQVTPKETISFLDEHCPLKENATDTQFDFGIFLESLENGNAGHVNFVQKFFYSFWWGLRNLSNFGTSLDKTSTYVWENCFAILISIVGLLLFLYLIGNVQTLMQFETTKWEEIRRKMQMKELDLQVWMERNKIPADVKKKILQSIKKKLEEDKDANLENLYNVLPWDTRKNLKRFLCMHILVKEPMLQDANPRVVKMICDYLKPVTYAEKSDIFTAREPLDSMLFITQGTVWIYSSDSGDNPNVAGKGKMAIMGSNSPSMITRSLETGDSYGVEQLISWAAGPNPNNSYSSLPGSADNVRCHTKVEGFTLMASDLLRVVSRCKSAGLWDLNKVNISPEQKEEAARSTISVAVRRYRNQSSAKKSSAVGAHDQNSPINNV